MKMFTARPDARHHEAEEERRDADDWPRRNRSANHPNGTMPRTMKPPEIPATNTMTPLLTWNEAWMFGAKTASP